MTDSLRVKRRLAVQHLGQAEVADLGRAVGRQEHVRGLQVAMDDTLAMGLGDPQGHLLGKPSRPRRGPGRAVELLVQAAAGDVLQLEERQAIGVADVADLDDRRMLRAGRSPRPRSRTGPRLRGWHARRPGSS